MPERTDNTDPFSCQTDSATGGAPGQSASESRFGPMQLMATRRFAPFFWTQFMGAFNDNVFKNALMLLLAFQAG